MNKKLTGIIIISILLIIVGIIAVFIPRDSSTQDIEAEETTSKDQPRDDIKQSPRKISSLEITNLDEISPDSDPKVKLAAQNFLSSSIQKNYQGNESNFKGKIREGTFKRSDNNNILKETMIIDIPNIKQSYGLTYFWSNYSDKIKGDYISSYCLDKDQRIYPDFSCKTPGGQYNEK